MAHIVGDAQGNVAAIEIEVYRQALREAENGAVFTTNAWFAPELADDNATEPAREAVIANSRDRFANLQRLVREVP